MNYWMWRPGSPYENFCSDMKLVIITLFFPSKFRFHAVDSLSPDSYNSNGAFLYGNGPHIGVALASGYV